MPYSIPKRVYNHFIAPVQRWKDLKFVEHGLGLMPFEEHQLLVKIGAIKCYKGVGNDTVLADYPKLVIHKSNGEEDSIDLGGDMFQLTQERDNQQKQGKKCRIEYFPRKYSNYMEEKYGHRDYDDDREAISQIAENFGGEIIPDF